MTWSVPPIDFGDDVSEALAQRRTEAALFALRGVVLKTPVDTGRARGSWNVTHGRPVAVDRGAGSQNEGLSRGYSEIESRASSPFEVTYITNGLPYIGKLESGSSRQAPSGMVLVTFNDLRIRFS